MSNCIFIFRRDHRLHDNIGLIEALKEYDKVIPIFIFDPKQVDNKSNKYKSNNAVQFMVESLEDLDRQLKAKGSRLRLFYGNPADIVRKLLKANKDIRAVIANKDYTNYSKIRDKKIPELNNNFEDYLLQPIKNAIMKDDGSPYAIYTSFYKKIAKNSLPPRPKKNNYKNFINKSRKFVNEINFKKAHTFYNYNEDIWVRGGRVNALKILKSKQFKNTIKNYNKNRDYPAYNTTNLSAYINFGNISIREAFYAFGGKWNKPLNKQLVWRDYYFYINYFNPQVIKGPYQEKYKNIKWSNDSKLFSKWKKGQTGYPIIDAGMRQLNETGFMHNRVRMITASFVIKDLQVNWQLAEKYYAQQLVDYSIAINNGNWQWVAGTGASHMPYFRVFNPISQTKKYDPNAEYIKQWIPELKNVPVKDILNWNVKYMNYKNTIKYPQPMIDHAIQAKKVKKLYKN